MDEYLMWALKFPNGHYYSRSRRLTTLLNDARLYRLEGHAKSALANVTKHDDLFQLITKFGQPRIKQIQLTEI